ncbi:MAG: putative chemoreceptor glutamine deamidase CheD [Desulfotomaculum sp. 46_80]|nr:MAG: putative chemoreceptor glutamine deamidase CheD [Desulfotomaculum sp. 46_80]
MMAALEIPIGIAEYKVTREPNRLITLGLGSCVGVSLYDPVTRAGGLIHIMLPDSTLFEKQTSKTGKFADTGIPLMIRDMLSYGVKINNLEAKMVGGAQMFDGVDHFKIGQRNIEKSDQILNRIGIKVIARETGGNKGRTMILDTITGQVTIRLLGCQIKII